MTPQEKAKYLFNKFYDSENCHKNHFPNNRFCDCVEMNRFQAKQCALICVDELIELSSDTIGYLKIRDYLEEVKDEIKKQN